MTLADPPPSMEFSIMDFFFEPFPYWEIWKSDKNNTQNVPKTVDKN